MYLGSKLKKINSITATLHPPGGGGGGAVANFMQISGGNMNHVQISWTTEPVQQHIRVMGVKILFVFEYF